jgi:hypothetical protein
MGFELNAKDSGGERLEHNTICANHHSEAEK